MDNKRSCLDCKHQGYCETAVVIMLHYLDTGDEAEEHTEYVKAADGCSCYTPRDRNL